MLLHMQFIYKMRVMSAHYYINLCLQKNKFTLRHNMSRTNILSAKLTSKAIVA